MGRKSSIENKNVYLTSREEAGLTREKASEEMMCSSSTLERIERGTQRATPSDVVRMADAYRKPELCNYYCVNECEIGQANVPEVKIKNLSQIVLNILDSLNALEEDKKRLINITSDEEITDDELKDFARIEKNLEKISITAEAMKLWIKQMEADGKIDGDAIEALKANMD